MRPRPGCGGGNKEKALLSKSESRVPAVRKEEAANKDSKELK